MIPRQGIIQKCSSSLHNEHEVWFIWHSCANKDFPRGFLVFAVDIYEGVVYWTVRGQKHFHSICIQGTEAQWIFCLSNFETDAVQFLFYSYIQIMASADFGCNCDPAKVLQNQSQLFQNQSSKKKTNTVSERERKWVWIIYDYYHKGSQSQGQKPAPLYSILQFCPADLAFWYISMQWK